MTRLATRALIAGLVLALLPVALPAVAQDDADSDSEAKPADEKFTEVVTVTARKREETAQEVPFSLVAQTEETLRNRGAQQLEDVAANVAGFTVQNLGPGQSQVAMRGISGGQVVRDQPGVKEQVGVYLDESVISLSLFTPDMDLFDMNRVEVLRGPQGTLFGSGSLSGTVRYITNQPEIGTTDSFAEITAGFIDDGEFGGSAKVATNQPLGDNSAVRITAYYNAIGGYMDAVQPDLSVREDVNSGDRTGVRIAIRSQPNDRLTITPRLIYQEVEMDGWNRIDDFNILANPFTTSRPPVRLGERQLFTQFDEPFTDEFLLADLNVEYAFDNMLFTSITSFTDRDVLVVRDATALTASITGPTIGFGQDVFTLNAPLDDATTAEMITQEFRLAGGGDRVNWVGGLFYSTIDRDYGQSLLVAGFEDLTGIPTMGNFGAGKDILFFSDLRYNFDQIALFGELTFAVNDRLDLTAGLRAYDFEEDRTQVFDGIFADPGPSSGSTTADGFAPRLIADYALNERTNLNFQVSKGFRLGGINDPLNLPLCTEQDKAIFGGRPTWDDEEVWNYEIGAKSSVMGGRGIFNVAAYYMDISDLQATVTAGSCSSRIVFNVPEAENRGIELEFSGATGPNFDFAFSASFNDSELKSDAAGDISGIASGRRLPTVPEFQGAAAATYQWQTGGDRLAFVTGTYQYVGSRYTQVGDQAAGFGVVDMLALSTNTGLVIGGPLTQRFFRFDPELPSYDLLNLRVGLQSAAGWEVALFVNNVTDEIAFLALDQERGTRARVGYLTNQPRTFGVTARFDF